ncbi:hypothetical protein D3C76_229420 [compost metagenome]
MPSLEASSSTASSDDQPVAKARRKPAMNAGRVAGTINLRSNSAVGSCSTAPASRSFGWASRTPTNVWRVMGTTMALTSTTNFSSSPIPNSTMNKGTQASVGICARALNVGRIKRSARRLEPSNAPSNAPRPTPASRPSSNRCRLIAK